MKLRSKPYAFQREDRQKIEDLDCRALVAWDAGLGKSFEALWLYSRACPDRPLVVVCPAVVKIGWAREARKHLGKRATVLYGLKPQRLPAGPNIWVINYDILDHGRQSRRNWVAELRRVRPGMVVIDEVHFCKSEAARRSKAVAELCRGVPRVLGLSGTPIVSRPMDLWFPLSVINPAVFPSRFHYGLYYCAGHKGDFGRWDFTGASNLPELYQTLTTRVMVRRKKEDVLKDLPPKTRTVLPLELPRAARQEYREAVDDFLGWLAKKSRAKALRALFSEGMARVGYLKRLAAELKLPLVIDWVRNYLEESDQKLILFGIHNRILRDGLFPEFKGVAVLVNGQITGAKRQAAIDRFNTDKDCRLFVGNVHAAGVGWSCTSADTVAFAELDWVPATHLQAEERCRGIGRGTGRPVASHWLVAEGTLEEDLCRRLQKRSDVISQVLDGKPTGDLQVFKFLVEVLQRQGKTLTRKKAKR